MKFYFNNISDLEIVDIKGELETQGYCVLNYTGTGKPLNWEGDMVNWMDRMSLGREYQKLHGILKAYGAGQAPFMWEAREWLYPLFQLIWGTPNLLCSFDGFNAGGTDSDPANWLHRDQRTYENHFKCIQGCINLNRSGGTALIPGSHVHSFENLDKVMKDWVRIPEGWFEHDDIVNVRGETEVSVTLWDSRLWHSNWRVQGENRRALYVSFLPKPLDWTRAKSDKRGQFIQKGVTTSHWANKLAKNSLPRELYQRDAKKEYVPIDHMGEIVKLKTVINRPYATYVHFSLPSFLSALTVHSIGVMSLFS